jgi:hypothetical protein
VAEELSGARCRAATSAATAASELESSTSPAETATRSSPGAVGSGSAVAERLPAAPDGHVRELSFPGVVEEVVEGAEGDA